MLATLRRELPTGAEWRYEPKWDGFRALIERDADAVEIWSRNGRPLGRYFPELVGAIERLGVPSAVVDGEIVVDTSEGFDFEALMSRLHPAASLVARRSRELPASFVAFDVLSVGDVDLRNEPFMRRREELTAMLADASARISVTPMTHDAAVAESWLDAPPGAGIDGVVAKQVDLRYREGARAMVKVKRERTMDVVVGGIRVDPSGTEVTSLLLGLYDGDAFRHVGVAAGMARAKRLALVRDVAPFATPLAGHPWEHGFALEGGPLGRLRGAAGRWTPDLVQDWIALAPVRVCEVAYDHVDGFRLRHPARFRHWRFDRDAESCSVEQLTTSSRTTDRAR